MSLLEHQPTPSPSRVLSIQSSVVHGYVGNKCAVFPLQLLGFDVDPIHSVQFSNHTGYPVVCGRAFDGAHLLDLLEGLTSNNLAHHTHLLTGYIGSLSLLEAVNQVAVRLREHGPLCYVCDPVLGDEGKLYVSAELVDAYRTHLLPLASVLTPNQYEAELLSGVVISSEADALAACAALHALGPDTVVITSTSFQGPPGEVDAAGQAQEGAHGVEASQGGGPESRGGGESRLEQVLREGEEAVEARQGQQQGQQGYITLLASTRLPQRPGRPAAFRLQVPRVPGYFTGTGDLLAALLLAWITEHPGDLATAVETAVAGLQGVLQATAAACGPAVLASKERSAEVFRARELRLVQNQHLLRPTQIDYRAQPLQPQPASPPM